MVFVVPLALIGLAALGLVVWVLLNLDELNSVWLTQSPPPFGSRPHCMTFAACGHKVRPVTPIADSRSTHRLS